MFSVKPAMSLKFRWRPGSSPRRRGILEHLPTSCELDLTKQQCVIKAKVHYTGPTGPARTRTDFFARPGPQTRVSDKVRAGPPSGI